MGLENGLHSEELQQELQRKRDQDREELTERGEDRKRALEELAEEGNLSVTPEDIEAKVAEINDRKVAEINARNDADSLKEQLAA